MQELISWGKDDHKKGLLNMKLQPKTRKVELVHDLKAVGNTVSKIIGNTLH